MAINWRNVGLNESGNNASAIPNGSQTGLGGALNALGNAFTTVEDTRTGIGANQLRRELAGAETQADVDAVQRDPSAFFSPTQDTFSNAVTDRGNVLQEKKTVADTKALNTAVSDLAKQRSGRRNDINTLQDAFTDSYSGAKFNDSGSLVLDSDISEEEGAFITNSWNQQAAEAPELLTDKQRNSFIDDLTTTLGATALQATAAKQRLNKLTTETEQLTDRQASYVTAQMGGFDTQADATRTQLEDQYQATLAASPVNFNTTLEQEQVKPGAAIKEIVAQVPETSSWFAKRKGGSDLGTFMNDLINGGYETIDPETGDPVTKQYPGWVLKEAFDRSTSYGKDDTFFALDRGVIGAEIKKNLDEVTRLHEQDTRSVAVRSKAKQDKDTAFAKLNLSRVNTQSIATREARSR